MNTETNNQAVVEAEITSSPQLYYTREQVAKMFVARVREVSDEWAMMPDLTDHERVHGAIAEVLSLIDSGNIANGVHDMMLSPRCDEVFDGVDDSPLPYPIVKHGADIAGNLHQLYVDSEAVVAGQELADKYTNDIGEYLVQFTNTTQDSDNSVQNG